MGIDSNNRDLFSRIVLAHNSRSRSVSSPFPLPLSWAGSSEPSRFLGGWADTLIMRSMDILMAFPGLLAAIAIVSVLGRD